MKIFLNVFFFLASVWVNNTDYGNKLTISGGGTSGYVEFFGLPPRWLDKYYYEPVPTQELVLNKNLVQSPGWLIENRSSNVAVLYFTIKTNSTKQTLVQVKKIFLEQVVW